MSSEAIATHDEVRALCEQKYELLVRPGWAPLRRQKFGYALPADVYEATVAKCVNANTHWLDVGGGHSVFPDNPRLAHELASKCENLTAVDPSENVLKNSTAHGVVQAFLENYKPKTTFDLVTARMVVEHVAKPLDFVNALSRLVEPGGTLVIFTVHKWAPISIVSKVVPFRWHHPVKRAFWGGDESDTFPTHYLMNSRKTLATLLTSAGFAEESFQYLADLSMFGQFKTLNYVELTVWRLSRLLGVPYPENCLLGVYRRHHPSV